MDKVYELSILALRQKGWSVMLARQRRGLPEPLRQRYSWLAPEVVEFVVGLEEAVSPSRQAWLLGIRDFSGLNTSAFGWNAWEAMSLDAAGDDEGEIAMVTSFWHDHFPFLMSVKDGYSYFALRRPGLQVVVGDEPEFEASARPVGYSLSTFLERLSAPSHEFGRWV